MWRELMNLHSALDARFRLGPTADVRFRDYVDLARGRGDYAVRVAADASNAPIGFVIACVLPNSPVYANRWIGYINDVCVTEAHRGRGIGRALVVDASRWLVEAGAQSVEVYVAMANPKARRFWRRLGAREYLERLTLEPEALNGDG